MNYRKVLLWASSFGFLAVLLGAFAAHSLKARWGAGELLIFETAVRYQFYHTFALFGTGILMKDSEEPFLGKAAFCFISGILLFSGSLYLLAATAQRFWGMVTPFGGLSFLAGWVFLFRGSYKIVRR